VRQASLLFGGLAFNEPDFLALWRKLPADPEDLEVRRNLACTQPLLWLAVAGVPPGSPGGIVPCRKPGGRPRR
jgi:hypothetical protein